MSSSSANKHLLLDTRIIDRVENARLTLGGVQFELCSANLYAFGFTD